MHKGFELFLDKAAFADCYNVGKKLYDGNKAIIKSKLDSFLLPNGSLDGSKMQANWFPQITANIFISHSHADERLAICLAGWLKKQFGLSTFIDSCIWGYANDLLKMVDDVYCKNISGGTYNYQKRNYSTSHIHMMLSTALSMMIDKTECIFFLNTPNSITPDDVISKTESPWIYSEIAMTRLIRKQKVENYRLQRIVESFSQGGPIQKNLRIEYGVNTDHLTQIKRTELDNWDGSWEYTNPYNPEFTQHALDVLYLLTTKK